MCAVAALACYAGNPSPLQNAPLKQGCFNDAIVVIMLLKIFLCYHVQNVEKLYKRAAVAVE